MRVVAIIFFIILGYFFIISLSSTASYEAPEEPQVYLDTKPIVSDFAKQQEAITEEKEFDWTDIPALTEGTDDYILIDLQSETLWLIKDGIEKAYPVLAYRAEGSKYDTPKGSFQTGYKSKNHLSSYFDVWMPYSIQFNGDFFLHGYPTYNDPARTPVPWGISGGCIRMDTEDMKEIYEQTPYGTPIIIF